MSKRTPLNLFASSPDQPSNSEYELVSRRVYYQTSMQREITQAMKDLTKHGLSPPPFRDPRTGKWYHYWTPDHYVINSIRERYEPMLNTLGSNDSDEKVYRLPIHWMYV